VVANQIEITCDIAESNNRRKVIAKLGTLKHVDRFDVDQQFARSKWREAVISKFSLDEKAHEFLDAEVQRVAAAVESDGKPWVPIMKRLSEVEAAAPDYLWDGRIVLKTLSCIDGDGGVGKGLSMMDIAARGSRGDCMPPGNVPDGTFDPWGTLFITSEDSAEFVLKPRALAAGADVSRIITMASVEIPEEDRRAIELLQDVELIERLVAKNDIRLIVIDPYSEFIDAHLNMNSDPDNRKVLGPLAEMAQRTNSATVLVRHLNKKEGQSAQYRGVGSTAPLNASRAAYLVAPDPEDHSQRVMACCKFNIGPKPPSLRFTIVPTGTSPSSPARVHWEGECDMTAGELMKTSSKATGGKLERAKEIIKEILNDGPRGSNEVLGACDEEEISERTYHTARKSLGVTSERISIGKGGTGQWLLSLPSTNGEAF
tara:strand:- start:3541 stop:4827 length:1287 start_codon:yes stop_codon:yes gene_type:complete